MRRLLDVLIGCIFATGLLLYSAMAIARYAMPALTVDWSDEVVVMLILWAMLLTGYRIVLERSHIAVDLLILKVSPEWQRRLELTSTLALVVYASFMAFAGTQAVYDAWLLGERTESTAQVPTFLYFASLPVGMALMVGAASRLLIRQLKEPFTRQGKESL